MKYKTSELEGALLDAAVAIADGKGRGWQINRVPRGIDFLTVVDPE